MLVVTVAVTISDRMRIDGRMTDRRTMTKVTKNTSFCFDHQRLPDIGRNNNDHHETFCSYLYLNFPALTRMLLLLHTSMIRSRTFGPTHLRIKWRHKTSCEANHFCSMAFFWKTFASLVFTLFIKEAWQRQGRKKLTIWTIRSLIWSNPGQVGAVVWRYLASPCRSKTPTSSRSGWQPLSNHCKWHTAFDFYLHMACWIPLYVLLQGHFCNCILCLL